MASRVGLLGMLLAATLLVVGAARGEPSGSMAVYTVRVDPRLCPSPLCGGYWVALSNRARTRCADGLRRPRCYVARAIDGRGNPLEGIPEGALARGTIGPGRDDLGELVTRAVYAPASTAPVSGGYYRVVDTGIRCVRAPCFSYRATQVNGSTRTMISGVDLVAARLTARSLARARAALRTKDGLYARGGFTTGLDGGRRFHATRLFLRAP